MRGPLAALVLLVLGACQDRRDFDERYSDTSNQLEAKARQIDQNLSANVQENSVSTGR